LHNRGLNAAKKSAVFAGRILKWDFWPAEKKRSATSDWPAVARSFLEGTMLSPPGLAAVVQAAKKTRSGISP
jgi:hypothetical protein